MKTRFITDCHQPRVTAVALAAAAQSELASRQRSSARQWLISEKPCAYDPRVGTNRRKPELAVFFSDSDKRRKAEREAKRVVGICNARKAGNRELWFYPTIGADPHRGI
jgi:hypothetical protein